MAVLCGKRELEMNQGFPYWKIASKITSTKDALQNRSALQLISRQCGSLSIRLPMGSESTVEIFFAEVELQGIHCHGSCNIDPSPKVASSISTLAGPPIAIASVTTR